MRLYLIKYVIFAYFSRTNKHLNAYFGHFLSTYLKVSCGCKIAQNLKIDQRMKKLYFHLGCLPSSVSRVLQRALHISYVENLCVLYVQS